MTPSDGESLGRTQRDPETPERRPIERALDLGIFAPLGLALEFGKVVPELAKAGRRHIAFSQSLGRAAIKTVLNSLSAERHHSESKTGAVVGYDEMTARTVRTLLTDCDAQTLQWIEAHESKNKQRVTVLRAVATRRPS